MQTYLIINADDLGMSEGVNRGILRAHLQGVVTSTSVLVTAGAARTGIRMMQREAPRLGLGLHLNLSFGAPVLPARQVPSLVRRDGSFHSVTWGLGLAQHWRKKDVQAEFGAQLERFRTYAGTLPDHLDSHQLIGSLSPVCREAMLDLADHYDLPVRQGGRELFGQFERDFASWGALNKSLAPSLFRRYPFKRDAHIYARSSLSPEHFEYGFHGENVTLESLFRILDALPGGSVELVCHPGYAGPGTDSYAQRERELEVLTDERVKQRIAEKGMVLTTFAVLRQLVKAS